MLDERDLGNRHGQQITIGVLDRNGDGAHFGAADFRPRYPFGQRVKVDQRIMRVPFDRLEGKLRRAWMAHPADDTAMAAGRDIATGAGVGLLYITRRKNLFVEDRHRANDILAVAVGPDARGDIVDRIDDVAVAVVTDRPMRPLRRITGDR